MSIHFAAARCATWSPVARALARRVRRRAANDNSDIPTMDEDTLLRRALEHLGAHGLGAARNAYTQAERALVSGEREEFAKWYAICCALDRSLAERLEARQRVLNACA
jgi:hypothetical protein